MPNPRDVERGPLGGEEAALSAFAPSWQARDLVLDPWSGLSHKAIIGPGSRESLQPSLAPTWVGKHSRRLNAYRVLLSYLNNVSRAFLPFGRDTDEINKHREYGDAATLRDMIRTAALGEEPEIAVKDADTEPEEPDEPIEPGPDADEVTKRAFEKAKAKYDRDRERFDAQLAAFESARELQQWFDEWAEKEKFPLYLVDTENDAVGLGDGVYYLAWSNEKQRVRVENYEPGFYFPVLGDDSDYPDKVHLAWEEEDDDDTSKKWVRRITFERRKLPGNETRRYIYQDDDEDPSRYECVLTNARWRFDDLGDRRVDTLNMNNVDEFAQNADGDVLNEYPLGIDFVPLVHLPNSINLKHHYGESVLTRVAQIFDDIGETDTDLAVTADLAGAPPLAVKGRGPADGKLTSYGPGTVFFGEGVDVVDTSHALDALMKRLDALLERLSTNSRMPAVALGRVDPAKIEAGVILLLTLAPLRALVRDMRLVRADKYRLFFRMVQRLAMVGATGDRENTTPGGRLDNKHQVLTVDLKFGSYIPTDMKALVEMLMKLLGAHAASRASVLRILRNEGLDLDADLALELERIEHEDFEGGAALANALSSEAVAADYLGRDLPEPPAPGPGEAPTTAAPAGGGGGAGAAGGGAGGQPGGAGPQTGGG